MEYRVENKYLVSDYDLAIISQRLRMFMQQDTHQHGEYYGIRSLYFDDILDNCMKETEAGINFRKKYRIRIYDSIPSPINLEIKEKRNGMTKKTICNITPEEYDDIFQGGHSLQYGDRKVLNQLLLQMRCVKLQPKLIISYERTAFIYPSGNVRITFDRNITASKECDSFFDNYILKSIPILPTGMHILEVKYDEFVPDVIAKLLEIGCLHQIAFSKYYLGRLAVNGELYDI